MSIDIEWRSRKVGGELVFFGVLGKKVRRERMVGGSEGDIAR